jgi:hypothetical protein
MGIGERRGLQELSSKFVKIETNQRSFPEGSMRRPLKRAADGGEVHCINVLKMRVGVWRCEVCHRKWFKIKDSVLRTVSRSHGFTALS